MVKVEVAGIAAFTVFVTFLEQNNLDNKLATLSIHCGKPRNLRVAQPLLAEKATKPIKAATIKNKLDGSGTSAEWTIMT